MIAVSQWLPDHDPEGGFGASGFQMVEEAAALLGLVTWFGELIPKIQL